MQDTVHIKGLSELNNFLQELPIKLEKNVLRSSLRAGMKVVLPVAKANIHSISGELAKGLKLSTGSKGGRVTASIKAKGEHGWVARFVEYGTKPHLITAKKGGGLQLPDGRVLSSVWHKGARPKPFMRPALDQQASAAVVAAANYMKARLESKHGLDTADITIEAE
ncbi:MAG: HK97-gp10 family putative phage morphogenesis protein [Sterolibacterium sp.]